MLDCFDGILTLDDTCATGAGVIALNTLGINETMLGELTGPEDTPATLLAQCEQQARAVMHSDVTTWMAPRIVRRTFVDRANIGQMDERQEVFTGQTGDGGIVVEIDNPNSNAVLLIGRLGFWSDVGGPVPITIYDLYDGSVVATDTVDAIAGENVYQGAQIALPAYRRKVSYFISSPETSFYRVDIHGEACANCVRGNLGGGVHVWGARLPAATTVSRGNLQRVSHTSGLQVLLTLECDHAQMLCEVKSVLAYPYALKVAECIVRRGVHEVRRMNNQRIDMDLLKERADRYGQEYADAMRNVLGNMRLPDDRLCYACHDVLMSSVSIP